LKKCTFSNTAGAGLLQARCPFWHLSISVSQSLKDVYVITQSHWAAICIRAEWQIIQLIHPWTLTKIQ